MNIPGLENMDPASREQAKLNWALGEVEKIKATLIDVQPVIANLEKRIKELEDARQRQISFNSDISAKLTPSASQPKEPLKKNIIANLLSVFRRRK